MYTNPTATSTKLILSTDVKQIFHFLGYDYETFFNMKMTFFNGIRQEKYFRSSYFDDNQLIDNVARFHAYINVDQNEINRSFNDRFILTILINKKNIIE